MSTICSMIQGCGPFEQFKVETAKSREFPPSRPMRIGVLTFKAPDAGVSKYSVFGPVGDYTTPANSGLIAAQAVSSALADIPGATLIQHAQLQKLLDEQGLSLNGNALDITPAVDPLPVDALLCGDVTSFQRWYDMAGYGGIVSFDARLIHIRTREEHFSVLCTAVRRSHRPEELANELAAVAVRKLLES